jgi:hypothetical protein
MTATLRAASSTAPEPAPAVSAQANAIARGMFPAAAAGGYLPIPAGSDNN